MILFLFAILTVLFETPWMAAWGYRRRDELLLVVCVNIASNLILNLFIVLAFGGSAGDFIYILEAAVVVAEYAVYALALGPSVKLFLLTLGANCLSYGLGLLIF